MFRLEGGVTQQSRADRSQCKRVVWMKQWMSQVGVDKL
jgi:hypothetical protein